ncbi:hypothetical protein GF322_03320 [Candidatus Dependentiae bacterium]|nr:hypothetical protein [Candidatus Dependentiae bacterium]
MSKFLSDKTKNIKLGDKRFEILLNNLIKTPSSSSIPVYLKQNKGI